jgi:hypothetical protein
MSTGYIHPPPVRPLPGLRRGDLPPWPPWPATETSLDQVPARVERPERRSAAAVLPGLAAIGVFIVWAVSQAGYPVSHWAPGGLLIVALAAVALATVPAAWRSAPRSVRAAIGLLGAYTAWSYLSILWAGSPGDAYEGATRTLLYLAVFVLFALWAKAPDHGGWLLGAWTAAMVGLCGIELARLGLGHPLGMFADGRLSQPAGYPNAAAAQWLMAFWPAVALAGWPRLPVGLRALSAAGAVALAGLALLSQSRGSLFALPLTALAFFLVVPGRLRNLGVLAPVAAGVAAATPALLHVNLAVTHDSPGAATSAISVAVAVLAAAACGAGLALAAAVKLGAPRLDALPAEARARLRRSLAVGLAVVLGLGAFTGLAVVGSPAKRVEQAWSSFKHGYSSRQSDSSRLVSGLGSDRYDFYRVAWNGFTAHPLAGLGADNYQALYLRQGRSDETPRYPHSIELRTLEQTGLVGLLLLGGAVAAALVAAWSAVRRGDGSSAATTRRLVAAAALMPFAYWIVHGSFDWFWEFAGLGAPAFAALGIAASLAPRRPAGARAAAPGHGRWLAPAGAAVALCLAAVAMATLWASQALTDAAVGQWTVHPAQAYQQLDRAAQLNPFSDQPQAIAGSIAVREGDLARAQGQFQAALARSGQDEYARLELGAIDSALGDRAQAEAQLSRAVDLAPRDPYPRAALELVRSGGTVDVRKLDLALYQAGARLNR